MRLGGPLFEKTDDPESWVAALKKLGYTAAWPPIGPEASDDVVNAYAAATRGAGIIFAEVGAWSNPISPDEKQRQTALEKCCKGLALAERIGARCCVNIAGSRNAGKWDGPHPDNTTEETFDLIVQTVRKIIDAVKPTRTFYTLETMPWVPPDSVESYLGLIKAIDRKAFAVHMDPVNLVNSPRLCYRNGDLIREFFAKLGPAIKSCHAKDISLSQKLTVHLDEVRPGLGVLDYKTYLSELNRLDGDMPLMMEHLPNAQEYDMGAAYIRKTATEIGVMFR